MSSPRAEGEQEEKPPSLVDETDTDTRPLLEEDEGQSKKMAWRLKFVRKLRLSKLRINDARWY